MAAAAGQPLAGPSDSQPGIRPLAFGPWLASAAAEPPWHGARTGAASLRVTGLDGTVIVRRRALPAALGYRDSGCPAACSDPQWFRTRRVIRAARASDGTVLLLWPVRPIQVSGWHCHCHESAPPGEPELCIWKPDPKDKCQIVPIHIGGQSCPNLSQNRKPSKPNFGPKSQLSKLAQGIG